MHSSIRYTFLAAVVSTSVMAATDDFSKSKQGNFTSLKGNSGVYSAESGHAGVIRKSVTDLPGSLHIKGGEDKQVTLTLSPELQKKELLTLSFNGERWTGAKPFKFRIEAQQDGKWKEIYNGDKLRLRALNSKIHVDLKCAKYTAFRFTATTKEKSGVILDEIQVMENKPMEIVGVTPNQYQTPLLIRKDDAVLTSFTVQTEGALKPDSVTKVVMNTRGTTRLEDVESYTLYVSSGSMNISKAEKVVTVAPAGTVSFSLDKALKSGKNTFFVTCKLKESARIDGRVAGLVTSLQLKNAGVKELSQQGALAKRIGINVATGGDSIVRTTGEMMKCTRMRIPGMVTTKKGTLLAVYDLRWRQNGDLPGDIDVGLSRSTTGGRTWEAPRPVLDMKNYLGAPESKNGVGDPAILVDQKTGHIYIMGLLAHGLDRGWYWGVSKPGMDPKDTGQLIVTKSTDDGKTWSDPVNLTKDVKDPAWQLMLQGPGAGITKRDGTLVFAFQYKVKKGKGYSANSALLYSKDNGKTWKISAGVQYPQETTEAQVVELNDGSLMLNCRISAGGRAVFTTKDLGETWVQHKTSGRGTFNMTGCMASILRYSSTKDGEKQDILLFSGPADGGKGRRTHQSIRYSLDEGETWSKPYLLDQLGGGGYSCLSLIEEDGRKDIGIIYEGSQSNMTFERVTLKEIMGQSK